MNESRVVSLGIQSSGLNLSERNLLIRWRRSTFWVMLLGYVGYYLCRGNLPAAFPLLSETFQYSNAQLGLIAAYSEIAYAVGKFINGPLADRFGGRRIFLTGMAGAVFFNVVFAFSSSIGAFILVWCLCRYFLSMGWGGIVKTIGAWYPPEKNGTIMGLISVNFQFGGVAAVLFAGFLVAQGSSWQGLFLIPAATLSLIWIWSYFCSKDSPDSVVPGSSFRQSSLKTSGPQSSERRKTQIANYDESDSGTSFLGVIKSLFKVNLFRHLLVYSFLTTFLRSVFFFWTPKVLVDLGMGTTNAILKSALFPFLGCVGTILLGWYTDRYAKNGDRAWMMLVMLLCLTGCLFGVSWSMSSIEPSSNLIVFLIGMSGFFLLGPYSMTSGCLTLDIAGSKGAGSCAGMLDGVGYLGGALAAFGAGAISDELGWSQVFVILAVFAGLSALSSFLMSREYRKIALRTKKESSS